MDNYYDILGIPQNATAVEIKRAYKEKAKIYHPDINQGDSEKEEIFKVINDAYQTLSNPYSRSNYDLMMRYGSQYHSSQEAFYTSPPPVYRRRPIVRRPKFNSRENWIATGYAFLFAFIVAAIIKTATFFVQEHQAAELEKTLAARRAVFEQVVSEKERGHYAASLDLIEGMGRFYSEEYDMRDFKDQLVYDIRDIADGHLENGDFQQAVEYYDLLSEYSVSSTINYLMKMAKAYQGMGNFNQTLKIYQLIRLYGYSNASFYYDMGSLYEDAGNLELALEHYLLSMEKAIAEYEVTIGKAYPIVINASLVPKSHYGIYLKVAKMHLALKEYGEALKATTWPKAIWKDSIDFYQIEALSYQGLGQNQNMRRVVREAKLIDPNFSLL